jgi:hypothetical protein
MEDELLADLDAVEDDDERAIHQSYVEDACVEDVSSPTNNEEGEIAASPIASSSAADGTTTAKRQQEQSKIQVRLRMSVTCHFKRRVVHVVAHPGSC